MVALVGRLCVVVLTVGSTVMPTRTITLPVAAMSHTADNNGVTHRECQHRGWGAAIRHPSGCRWRIHVPGNRRQTLVAGEEVLAPLLSKKRAAYLLRSLPVTVGGKTLWFKVPSNIAVLLLPSMGSVKSTANVLFW